MTDRSSSQDPFLKDLMNDTSFIKDILADVFPESTFSHADLSSLTLASESKNDDSPDYQGTSLVFKAYFSPPSTDSKD